MAWVCDEEVEVYRKSFLTLRSTPRCDLHAGGDAMAQERGGEQRQPSSSNAGQESLKGFVVARVKSLRCVVATKEIAKLSGEVLEMKRSG